MADAPPNPLSAHDTIVQDPSVASTLPTISRSVSVFSTPAAGTSNASPSMPRLTPSRSQSQSTAAYASPEDGESPDEELAQPAPIIPEFRCPHCPEKRASRAVLNKHIKTHTQPYRCNCGVGKATQRDLDRHQDTHGKIRKYFCPVSGCAWDNHGVQGGFSRRLDNAKRHLKSHNNSHTLSVLREDNQGRLWRV